MVDQSLKINEITADIFLKKELLQRFISTHYRQRHYSFQVNYFIFFSIEILIYYLLNANTLFIK